MSKIPSVLKPKGLEVPKPSSTPMPPSTVAKPTPLK